MGVLEKATQDLAAGRPWLARDRLRGALAHRGPDPAVLDLLGQSYFAMNDLPAAGAVWFLSARNATEEEVQSAFAALHRRYPTPRALDQALPFKGEIADYPEAARDRLARLVLQEPALVGEWAARAWRNKKRAEEARRRKRTGGSDGEDGCLATVLTMAAYSSSCYWRSGPSLCLAGSSDAQCSSE